MLFYTDNLNLNERAFHMKELKTFIHCDSSITQDIFKSLLNIHDFKITPIDELDLRTLGDDKSLHIFEFPFSAKNFDTYKKAIERVGSYIIITPSSDFIKNAQLEFNQSEKLMVVPICNGINSFIERLKMNTFIKSFLINDSSELFKFNYKNLTEETNPECDLYLKFSTQKYTRVYDQDEVTSIDILNKYIDKGHDNFYLKSKDYYDFIDNVLKKQNQQVESLKPSISTLEKLNANNLHSVFKTLSDLNLDETTIQKANDALNSSADKIESSSDLFNMIKDINKDNNFLTEHSLLLAYVSSAIAVELELSDSYACEKLVLSSLLHDVSLLKHKNSSIHQSAEFEQAESKEIRLHPFQSTEIVKSIPNISPDVDKIIMQHHETQNGDGYPKGLTFKDISMLATIFIISEDFVTSFYNNTINSEFLNGIISKFGDKYTKSNFRAVYTALCRVISKSDNKLFYY